jgi:hypothetical protein
MNSKRWLFGLFFLGVFQVTSFSLEQPKILEWWVMAGKEAHVLVEPGLAVRAKFEVGINPTLLILNDDQSLVAISSNGAVKPNFTWSGITELWPLPGSSSSISLIKRPSMELLGTYTVPFRPGFMSFTTDNKTLVVVSLGQVSKNAEKHIPPQIFLMDVSSGKIRNAVQLASQPSDYWYVPAKNRLLVPCAGFMKRADAPPELVVFDTVSGSVEKIKLPSAPSYWREMGKEELQYLELEKGVVVVTAEGKLQGEPITAGTDKLFFIRAPQGNHHYLAGKTKKQGSFLLLDGGQVVKSVEGPIVEAALFDSNQSRLFLCVKKQGLIVDPATLKELDRIPLPNSFLEVRLAPGEKRLYVNQFGDQVVVVDLEKKQEIARFTSGRGSIKFLQELGAAAANMLGQMAYEMGGVPPNYVTVPRAVQTMAFAPSGKFVYVFNSQTNDITVVETENHTSPRKVPTGLVLGNNFLWQLPGGRHLISVGANKVLTLDTETGEVVTEQQFHKATLRYEPSLGLLFVQTEAGMEVHRPVPFEKVKDMGASGKLLFVPEGQRFFLFSPKGAKVYDYQLNLLKELEGITEEGRVFFVPEKAEKTNSPGAL